MLRKLTVIAHIYLLSENTLPSFLHTMVLQGGAQFCGLQQQTTTIADSQGRCFSYYNYRYLGWGVNVNVNVNLDYTTHHK